MKDRMLEGSSVLFLSSRVGEEIGRTERRLLATMRAAAEQGAHVHFIGVPRGALVAAAREAGHQTAVYRLDTSNIIRTRSRLRKYLRRYAVRLAHSTGFEADVILRLASRGQPVRVVNSLTRNAWPPSGIRGPFRMLDETLQLRTLPRADGFLVDAHDMRSELIARGIDSDAVVLDPPTIDLARVATAAKGDLPELPSGVPLVGYAGRLERGRGIPVLVDAARLLRENASEARVIVGGEGPERAAADGSPDVFVTGDIPSVPALLAALAAVVVPSVGPGMPAPLLEALALGRPVVATGVAGVAEFFVNGAELLLVPPGDPAALAAGIAALLADPLATAAMCDRARHRVVDYFSTSAGVRRHLALYEYLLQR